MKTWRDFTASIAALVIGLGLGVAACAGGGSAGSDAAAESGDEGEGDAPGTEDGPGTAGSSETDETGDDVGGEGIIATGETGAEESGDDVGGEGSIATGETGEEAGSDESGDEEDPFSFFVTSLEGMQQLSGSLDGFGGDLGGLDGADGICQQLAASVGGGAKTWRAFLSVTAGPDGQPVHAIDRIGEGPWYDRYGRLVAEDLAGLLQERPEGDPQIIEDLPNELGQGQKQFGDNHDTLTGSTMEGTLYSDDPASTCNDWPSSIGPGTEKKVMGGHSWPREEGGPGGGGGGPGAGNAPPPWKQACQGLAIGDECTVDKGPKKFDSTCAEVEGSDPPIIACIPDDAGGGGGQQNPAHWLTAHTVPGCAAGIQLEQVGGGQDTDVVGGGGGYGGSYCVALSP